MEDMRCPRCHSTSPKGSNFCMECGTQFSSTEATSADTKTFVTPRKELEVGTTFAGRYQILDELGKGGMGIVYLVLDTEIKERIALKILNPEISADSQMIERFRNELKFSRKISSDRVCRMYDLGETEGLKYITMEYVHGENLKSIIQRVGRLSVGKATSIARQICEGLEEAHKLGVIHRDLKPSNIMIDSDGNVCILDFGVARSLKKRGLTTAGILVGTPQFMSPEQLEGKDVDQRSDIYSLGVLLYLILTGKVPFEGKTPVSVALRQKDDMLQDPMEINSQISQEFNRLILKCMERDIEKRYQNIEDLNSELKKFEADTSSFYSVSENGAPATDHQEKVPDQRRPEILIVDDESMNIELIEDLLSPLYDVMSAHDGKDALEKVTTRTPDLILLDIMMPHMDGYEVCEQLKKNRKTRMIPVVMVTALKEKEERLKALEVGADDFLSKPIDRSELLARVKSLLRISHLYRELEEINRALEHRVREQVTHIQNLGRLKQYFSPMLAEKLVTEEGIFKPKRKNLTIFFVDIRNFNSFIEVMEPEELFTLLDDYFSVMTRVIFDWGGTVGKFISDGIMGFFGDPEDCPNHAELAIKMALEMKYRVSKLNEESTIMKDFPISIGIGINTGYATVGNIGPKNHRDYTVIGRHVNLAARLETIAEEGQILISQRTYGLVKDIIKAKKRGTTEIKGFEKPVEVYEVLGLL